MFCVSAGALSRICSFTRRSMRLQLVGGHRLEVREVEAQAVRRHQRALLLHMRAQDFAQRGVQQVRGGVIAADVVAARIVDAARQLRRPP